MTAMIKLQIQEQMEQAVECIDAGQFTAASVHYVECAELCKLLEAERQAARASKKALKEAKQKQLTINV